MEQLSVPAIIALAFIGVGVAVLYKDWMQARRDDWDRHTDEAIQITKEEQ